MSQSILLASEEENAITVEFSPEKIYLTAEWAGDIYGEGYLDLNRDQAVTLAHAILAHFTPV
ncbi:hypothetical protein [Citrobacter phage Tr1]|nr:hypothetical protein [Citrobacter phage Tr1]